MEYLSLFIQQIRCGTLNNKKKNISMTEMRQLETVPAELSYNRPPAVINHTLLIQFLV